MGGTVFFLNGFGDSVIARPALSALAKILPKPTRLIVGNLPNRFVFDDLGYDFVIPVAVTGADLASHHFDMSEALGLPRADLFVSLVPWTSPQVEELAKRLGRKTFGLFDHFDHWVKVRTQNAVEHAFELVNAIDPTQSLSAYRHPLSFSENALALVEQIRSMFRNVGVSKLIAVHSDTQPEKEWHAAGYRDVMCKVLSERPDFGFLVVGRPKAEVGCPCHSAKIMYLDKLRLEAAMAVVSNADAFLGINSCMLHVADLSGVPGATIFGPTRAEEFGYFWGSSAPFQFTQKEDVSFVREVADTITSLAIGGKSVRRMVSEGVDPALDRNLGATTVNRYS